MVASPTLPSPGVWGGRERILVDGKFTGPHYQKRSRHVADSSVVGVNRGAEDNANVPRQHFNALPFVTVVDSVWTTNSGHINLLSSIKLPSITKEIMLLHLQSDMSQFENMYNNKYVDGFAIK